MRVMPAARAFRRALASAAKPALWTPSANGSRARSVFDGMFSSRGAIATLPPMDASYGDDVDARGVIATPPRPTTSTTVLKNGATIASENTPGVTVALGAYCDVGSAHEKPWQRGFAHALERAAFKSTSNRSAFRVTRECEVIGANLSASASREQFCFAADALKTRAAETTELLLDCAMNASLHDYEIEEVVKSLKEEVKELNENPQAMLMEAAHATAYSGGLGAPLVAPGGDLSHIDGDSLREFVRENMKASRIVLAASGIDHDELVRIAEPLLLTADGSSTGSPQEASTYTGGDFRQKTDAPIASMILGFEFKGGWRDVKASTAMTVLTMLLGGGGSFSAGGPGKGMYSRLYTRVLNRYSWAQNCTAFHSIFNDTGIVGISAMANSAHVGDMAKVMASELQAVAAKGGIDAKELERAKNATVSSILMNLESKAVIAEDIGRQMLTYKYRKSADDFIAEVRAVTAADVAQAASNLLASEPTFAASGDLYAAPRFDEIKAMFK